MRALRGLPALAPEVVLVLRDRRPALRAAGHATQSLLAERTNASALDPARVDEARLRLERAAQRAAEAADRTARRSGKEAAQRLRKRLRKAAGRGDARAEVKLEPATHGSNTG
jgi:hypothetical protein